MFVRRSVIALIVTPEGFPLAYEVMPGNTSGRTTLRDFLARIQPLYGTAERIWVMDRGIPTEEVLAEMRASDPPICYLVGTPKGRLTRYEQELLEVPWQKVREDVEVTISTRVGPTTSSDLSPAECVRLVPGLRPSASSISRPTVASHCG